MARQGFPLDITVAVEAGARALAKAADVEWDTLAPIQQHAVREQVLPVVTAVVGPIVEAWTAATVPDPDDDWDGVLSGEVPPL